MAEENNAVSVPVLPSNAKAWSAAAKADILAAYLELFNNHPGVYDEQNPNFLQILHSAKAQGLLLAEKVNDAVGYDAAINRFSVGLQDGHAGVFTRFDEKTLPKARWPGFVGAWRGDALYVYKSESTNLPIGAKVLGCDGIEIRELIKKNFFSFIGIENQPGEWWWSASRFLYDYGNPFVAQPKRCQFELDGRKWSHTLQWRETNDNFDHWRKESRNGDRLPVGLTEPRKGLLWVAMPNFQPDEQERTAYRQMTAEIKEHRERAMESDAVVIDLRHNQGGSSAWSKDFARALWGADRVNRRLARYSAKQEVWWRSSPDNVSYVAELVERLKSEKQFEVAEKFEKDYEGMKAALLLGDKYYSKPKMNNADEKILSSVEAQQDHAGDPPALTRPVYVIVPGQCASACLDALDVFTQFDNTKLIGAPSSADSTYMEVRYKKLPSGLATVVIPNKVYMNRARVNGQFYSPALMVKDLDWSSANFLRVIELDLKSPAVDKP